MKVEIEKQEKNLVQIKLDIPSEHAQQEYNKACRRIGQRVNVPGFRRGKAPLKMIEKAVGAERIKQEALERILPNAFAEVITEHQLDVVAPPRVNSYDFDTQKGINVLASVELRPEVKLPDLALTVKVPEVTIAEEAEQKELDRIVEQYTTLDPVIDRAAEATDIINLNFDGTLNGEPIPGGSAKNYRLDLENNTFIEGFAEQLVGHSLGENFNIEVTFPEDYFESSLAGQKANFEIKINEIHKRSVPELSDELAAKVGDFKTLDELKVSIRERLKENSESELNQRKQRFLVQELVNQIELDIPNSMVQREAKILLEEVQERFTSQGLSWADFVESQGEDQILANLQEEAANRIKTSLAFGAIAKQETITVSEDEFQEQVRLLAEVRKVDEKTAMRQLANNPSSIQAMTDQVLAKKVVDFLLEKATFEVLPESEFQETVTPEAEAKAEASEAAPDESEEPKTETTETAEASESEEVKAETTEESSDEPAEKASSEAS